VEHNNPNVLLTVGYSSVLHISVILFPSTALLDKSTLSLGLVLQTH